MYKTNINLNNKFNYDLWKNLMAPSINIGEQLNSLGAANSLGSFNLLNNNTSNIQEGNAINAAIANKDMGSMVKANAKTPEAVDIVSSVLQNMGKSLGKASERKGEIVSGYYVPSSNVSGKAIAALGEALGNSSNEIEKKIDDIQDAKKRKELYKTLGKSQEEIANQEYENKLGLMDKELENKLELMDKGLGNQIKLQTYTRAHPDISSQIDLALKQEKLKEITQAKEEEQRQKDILANSFKRGAELLAKINPDYFGSNIGGYANRIVGSLGSVDHQLEALPSFGLGGVLARIINKIHPLPEEHTLKNSLGLTNTTKENKALNGLLKTLNLATQQQLIGNN